MLRWIMHADMDAFFASVEQLDNPELKGLPVIVGGLSGRGVVSTCSYEARKFGVHSAMPMHMAKRLCPQGVFVQGRMRRYKEVSDKIMEIFHTFSPLIEQLSVDEAFLDVTGMEGLYPDVITLAKAIKAKVYAETGLRVSVGVAPNKFLAKLASDLEKPDGLVLIKHETAAAFIAPMPVRKIFGIGKAAEAELLKYGIDTIGKIAAADIKILQRVFGINAQTVHDLACGIDNRPVVNETEAKSIGKEHTYDKDLYAVADLRSAVRDLCGETGWRLRNHGLVGYTVTLKVKFSSFKIITRSITSEMPVAYDEEIYALALKLLQQVKLSEGVRLLGISISHLEQEGAAPVLNFNDNEKLKKRNAAVDFLKNKFGEGIIKRG